MGRLRDSRGKHSGVRTVHANKLDISTPQKS
jgi:hypothetical protein